jgi:hypothetical protein
MRAIEALENDAVDEIGGIHKANLIIKLFVQQADIDLPEQKLWMAVLGNSVMDLMLGKRSTYQDSMRVERARREAVSFFCERRHVTVCDWVGLNPDWVLEVLRDHAGLEV